MINNQFKNKRNYSCNYSGTFICLENFENLQKNFSLNKKFNVFRDISLCTGQKIIFS
ncbi:hypothetical protein DB41_AS00040 [Neochlamydia sp. TUME1]|nr:hypothetical protein DB41_AS00040 [Neochlamydia sp. TUME1]